VKTPFFVSFAYLLVVMNLLCR